uniref:SWIM-type domain-containing protein n=1 Tax=Clytia hemisphaerica TaxID=252671 RepID=A0A7M5V903_9CNID
TCEVGLDGSVCKHQYVVWSHKLGKGRNFLPYLNAEERKGYAYIAIGKSLPDSYYEGIHSDNTQQANNQADSYTTNDEVAIEKIIIQDQSEFQRNRIEQTSAEECRSNLRKTKKYLITKIDSRENDQSLLNGIMTFCDRVQKYPTSRLTSLFHSFGSTMTTSRKITANSILKKAKRGKIFVQPGAVQRRASLSGSRNARVKGMQVKNNPFVGKIPSRKRPHAFSDN